jgi:formate-dependent phosphoribosylglycinamide formyltransferase (GAR transformylase)
MIKNILKFSAILPILAVVMAALPARADVRNFTMVNDSSEPILSLHVSSVSAESWEDDILGADLLGQDDSLAITFDSAVQGRCMYDVKIVVPSGDDVVASGINLCTTGSVIYDGKKLVVR